MMTRRRGCIFLRQRETESEREGQRARALERRGNRSEGKREIAHTREKEFIRNGRQYLSEDHRAHLLQYFVCCFYNIVYAAFATRSLLLLRVSSCSRSRSCASRSAFSSAIPTPLQRMSKRMDGLVMGLPSASTSPGAYPPHPRAAQASHWS